MLKHYTIFEHHITIVVPKLYEKAVETVDNTKNEKQTFSYERYHIYQHRIVAHWKFCMTALWNKLYKYTTAASILQFITVWILYLRPSKLYSMH